MAAFAALVRLQKPSDGWGVPEEFKGNKQAQRQFSSSQYKALRMRALLTGQKMQHYYYTEFISSMDDAIIIRFLIIDKMNKSKE